MNRDEALDYLLRGLRRDWPTDWSTAKLDAAIDALSSPCACEGRELIARRCTYLDGPVLGILILDVDSTDKAYDGPVDVLVFAANEGGKEQGDGA